LKEKLVALEIDFGVLALRLILGELTLGLFELDLKRSWVNLDQNIPLVNVLTFLEGHVDNLTVHAAAHGDGVKCRYGSQIGRASCRERVWFSVGGGAVRVRRSL